MVDALTETKRVLVDRGLFVDARPDSRVLARVRAGSARGKIIGSVDTQRETKADDVASDRALREALRRRLFRSRRRGRFWHAIRFADSADLQAYLDDHLRFSRRIRWRVPAAKRTGPLFLDRAIRFEVLERR